MPYAEKSKPAAVPSPDLPKNRRPQVTGFHDSVDGRTHTEQGTGGRADAQEQEAGASIKEEIESRT